jgi:alpha-D-glucose phosphate-specific phosphoglucomutase
MTNKIKFGTDGWRGVIADTFTFENVRIVSQAVADYLTSKKLAKRGIAIGYDCRFMSERFAEIAAEVFAGNGIKVFLTTEAIPTPMLSFIVPHKKLAGGVMLTASHNPPRFNGFKFKPDFGGSATDEITNDIEGFLGANQPQTISFDEARKKGFIEIEDFSTDYFEHCWYFLERDWVGKSELKIVYDAMHGSGKHFMAEFLKATNYDVITIAGERNPYFGGRDPEPIIRNFAPLVETVKAEKADIGLGTDGDADRIGAVNMFGESINPHQVFALLTLHLIRNRGWSGDIVKTISSTQLITKIAEKYERNVYITPVGFKYICDLMRQHDILIGGEESGGIGFKNHIPERDGILAGVLLLELMEAEGKPIHEIFADVEEEFGVFRYHRVDAHTTMEIKNNAVPKLQQNPPTEIIGLKVNKIDDFDGIKFYLEDDSWLLIRPSGTEPVLRIYVESHTDEEVMKIIDAGERLAGVK